MDPPDLAAAPSRSRPAGAPARSVSVAPRDETAARQADASRAAPESDGGEETAAFAAGPDALLEWQEEFDEQFRQQERDPVWSETAERELRSAFARGLEQLPQVESLECRESLCRVETVHKSPQALQEFTLRAFKDPDARLWPGGGFSQLLAADASGLLAVSYFRRPDTVAAPESAPR